MGGGGVCTKEGLGRELNAKEEPPSGNGRGVRREEETLGRDNASMGSQREPLAIVSLWAWVS